ncbi:MAG: cobalt-precorrin-6A reductase [Geminicoccaceae bacterium]
MPRVLILGGTTEAAALAGILSGWPGLDVIVSLAGRTRTPGRIAGEMRIGGFGGPQGLAFYLHEQSIDVLIDATHPFAEQMSRHAVLAAEQVRVPRLRLVRPLWEKQPGDHWVDAIDAVDAAGFLPDLGRRAFLTTGHRDLAAFAGLDDIWFLIRTIEPVAPGPLPRQVHFLRARGPFDETAEIALLQEHRIDALITKASGGEATYAKITAARRLGLPVIMIQRPDLPPGPVVHDTESAQSWLRQVIA